MRRDRRVNELQDRSRGLHAKLGARPSSSKSMALPRATIHQSDKIESAKVDQKKGRIKGWRQEKDERKERRRERRKGKAVLSSGTSHNNLSTKQHTSGCRGQVGRERRVSRLEAWMDEADWVRLVC